MPRNNNFDNYQRIHCLHLGALSYTKLSDPLNSTSSVMSAQKVCLFFTTV